jgi:hypothetical protein
MVGFIHPICHGESMKRLPADRLISVAPAVFFSVLSVFLGWEP